MDYEQLVGFFGGPTKTADALGIEDRRTVHAWKTRRIPSKWQVKAETLSNGQVIADDEARAEAHEMAALVAERARQVAAA